ncbi:MAG TPA: CPBP family glutamic-type intramembrane protease [Methylomirabilota bacterium]|nr:CPBP family glutamic-type intramembrane protease [Methylomirabilota bacterium]
MWSLDQPYLLRAEPLLARTPLALLVVLAVGAGASAGLVGLQVAPPLVLQIAGVTAGHGVLLVTALAWSGVRSSSSVVAVVLLALAATAAAVVPLGAGAYLLPALWVLWLAARGQLAALGLGTPLPPQGMVAGTLVGAGLSTHLLLSASRTLGVQTRIDHAPEVLAAIAYDLGANVLTAECFFRGALFQRSQRRWSFAAAVAVATVAYVARYVVDPLLPKTVEQVIGAVFYLALLGVINCWLRWRYESLVPGLVSALVFFAAYRTLGAG